MPAWPGITRNISGSRRPKIASFTPELKRKPGRGIEDSVFWTTDLLVHLRDRGVTRIENTVEAEEGWVEHIRELYDPLLMTKTKSWFTGFNTNLEGRDTIRYVAYNGGQPRYRRRLAAVAAEGYEGFVLS